jgi:hypothetical protein
VQFDNVEEANAAVEALSKKDQTVLDSPDIEAEHFIPKDQR